MDYKDFASDSEIVVKIEVYVNDELATKAVSYDIDQAISELGKAERHAIPDTLSEQYINKSMPIEDEETGELY